MEVLIGKKLHFCTEKFNVLQTRREEQFIRLQIQRHTDNTWHHTFRAAANLTVYKCNWKTKQFFSLIDR